MNSQKGNWSNHDISPDDLHLFPIKEKLSKNHSNIIIIETLKVIKYCLIHCSYLNFSVVQICPPSWTQSGIICWVWGNVATNPFQTITFFHRTNTSQAFRSRPVLSLNVLQSMIISSWLIKIVGRKMTQLGSLSQY